MPVLATGNLGAIGAILPPMLARAGPEVIGLNSDLYSRRTFSAGSNHPDIPTIRKDTRDATSAMAAKL
jgi:hypothetical protein